MLNNDYFRAGNPSTPTEQLRDLLSSSSAEVRLRLAENVRCPSDVLAELSLDSCAEVRAAVGTNPSTPNAIVDRVARDHNAEVRLFLASDPELSPEVMNRLVSDEDERVRQRAQQTMAGLMLEQQLKQSGFQAEGGDAARLGDLIVMSGILTEEELSDYLSMAKSSGLPLGRVLAEQKALSQLLIVQLLNVQTALRNNGITTEQALVQLEECKLASLSQRKTQPIRPLRSEPARIASDSNLGIRALIDAAPDAIVIFDHTGIVLEWNAKAEIMLGITRRQAIGQQFGTVLVSESNARDPHWLNNAQNGLQTAVEIVVRDSRGGQIPIEITFSREAEDNSSYIAFIRDVSERKKLESRRSAQYYITRRLSEAQSLEQVGSELIKLLCESTGWDLGEVFVVDDRADVLRRSAFWRSGDSANDKPRIEEYKRGAGVPGYVWHNGRAAWIDNTRQNKREVAESNYTIALALPITFQHQIHGVLYMMSRKFRCPDKDSFEMLASCCSQFAQFIERQRAEKARQKVLLMEQREDFMYTLAHDLKTPLISGDRVLELLVSGSLGGLSPEQDKVLKMLKDSNQALLRMVKNLLAVYRYESGVETLHHENIDLRNLLKSAVDEVTPITEQKNLAIDLALPSSIEPLACDGLELRRVIANLLSNAIKYTADGGQIRVSLEDDCELQCVNINVMDNGTGIPEAERMNVFRRFWQGNQCHRAIGTGLGLHLCWKIVEAHGGTIKCESVEKEGSKFTVVLPRTGRAPAPPVVEPNVKPDWRFVSSAR